MKKLLFTGFTLLVTFMFGSVALARTKPQPLPAQPPAPGQPPVMAEGVINACYKNMNGQLRIVSDPGLCLPSETAISWHAAGQQGPSGVVATSILSGAVEPIASSAAEFVFAGPTATVTTTDTQRITGVAGAPLGTTAAEGAASFLYDLCYRPAGSADLLVGFAGPNSSAGQVGTSTGRLPFLAAGSVIPGAGDWEVGFCVVNSGAFALDSNDFVNGWVMVTN